VVAGDRLPDERDEEQQSEDDRERVVPDEAGVLQ
jgi:hypothetical protein